MFFKAKFSLESYGEEFKDCFVTLKILDRNQSAKYGEKVFKLMNEGDKLEASGDDIGLISKSSELVDFIYKTVKDSFVDGQVFDNGIRPMKVDDLDSFPPMILRELGKLIQGNLEKKS